ncbi:uncharacterized protein LOC126316760 [Schistocerca gregaria]|uniref:uncharacterized protein LOC126316760 n=1 Tax=Schistocerca gregaria TaxID=7010 RepID=UPI00211E7A5D|nr:uncharacterized protein LOC126316760 [Schistocerca gregaria]
MTEATGVASTPQSAFRLHIRGLCEEFTFEEVSQRFRQFGRCVSMEVVPEREFGYVQLEDSSPEQVKQAIRAFSNVRWKGHILVASLAKPKYIEMLKERWKRDEEKARKEREVQEVKRQRKMLVEEVSPAERNETDYLSDEFRPSLPENWVKVPIGVGRYLPVMNLGYQFGFGDVTVNPREFFKSIKLLHYHVRDTVVKKLMYRMSRRTIERARKEHRREAMEILKKMRIAIEEKLANEKKNRAEQRYQVMRTMGALRKKKAHAGTRRV